MRRAPLLAAFAALILAAAGCGGDDSGGDAGRNPVAQVPSGIQEEVRAAQNPQASEFPSPKGKTLQQLADSIGGGPEMGLAGSVYRAGEENRVAFGVIDSDAGFLYGKTALYIAKTPGSAAKGPYPAPADVLITDAPYRSQQAATEADPFAAVYATHVKLGKPGTYAVMAVAKLDGRLVATSPIGARVLARDPVPDVGDRAPAVETPTVRSVGGDVAKIDTRQPPDDMHDVSLKDVVGKKPVILVFATPALCQSRVCGPVVDIAQELKAEHGDEAAFIHMEIYRGNTIKNGCLEGTRAQAQCLRPQVLAYHLQTEPWAFAIDRRGKIVARLEGAYSKSELGAALKAAVRR